MINIGGSVPEIAPDHVPCSLRELYLQYSPCESVEDTITYLNHSFPQLSYLDTDIDHVVLEVARSGWLEVMERLPRTQQWLLEMLKTHDRQTGYACICSLYYSLAQSNRRVCHIITMRICSVERI